MISQFASYGIMADETTRAAIIPFSVRKTINSYLLNPIKCQYWLTDNTSYISGLKDGAVVKFNKLYSVNAIRIPCRLHALHIASTTFDNVIFEKISSHSELSLYSHPFNIINLAYYLHCGYNEFNNENLLNMKTETIINYCLKYKDIYF
ncbi:unnamed protein product [Rhizophagus irregularis]|nr:unnamed protein product [Rhizophagus irregularis]